MATAASKATGYFLKEIEGLLVNSVSREPCKFESVLLIGKIRPVFLTMVRSIASKEVIFLMAVWTKNRQVLL